MEGELGVSQVERVRLLTVVCLYAVAVPIRQGLPQPPIIQVLPNYLRVWGGTVCGGRCVGVSMCGCEGVYEGMGEGCKCESMDVRMYGCKE